MSREKRNVKTEMKNVLLLIKLKTKKKVIYSLTDYIFYLYFLISNGKRRTCNQLFLVYS